jgi:predicted RNA-binding protein with PIN domain
MNPMRILVDGHNLIPNLPGLHLGEIDVEKALIGLLQIYARQSRHKVEVFFDGAPPGKAGARVYAPVTARFVSERTIADHAIRSHLQAMGAEAKQTLVVSSDRQVQAEARALGAKTQASDQFARELVAARGEPPKPTRGAAKSGAKKQTIEPPLPQDQVQEWLDLFKAGKK